MYFMRSILRSFALLLAIAVCARRGNASTESERCESIVHLELGKEGIISCALTVQFVAWADRTEGTDTPQVIVTLDDLIKGGVGYSSGEYDVLPDGSLVISRAGLHHEGLFDVTARTGDNQLYKGTVEVIIFARPTPTYPVINNGINMQYAVLDSGRKGTITCSMQNVRPAISLEFATTDPRVNDVITFQNATVMKNNGNGTFDVSVRNNFEVEDRTIEELNLTCRVSEDYYRNQLFPDVTMVTLKLPAATTIPIVTGCQEDGLSCLVSVTKDGDISCTARSPDPDMYLSWRVHEGNSKLSLTDVVQITQNIDANNSVEFVVTLKTHYNINSSDSTLLVVTCVLRRIDEEVLSSSGMTYLSYLHEAPRIHIDGCHNPNEHCRLVKPREGNLTCSVDGFNDQNLTLRWRIDSEDVVLRESTSVVSRYDENTSISLTTSYYVADSAEISPILISCVLTEQHIPKYSATALLTFTAPPILTIDGCFSPQHDCKIAKTRVGELSCSVYGLPSSNVNLSWGFGSGSDSITLERSEEISKKRIDGNYDVSIRTPYNMTDSKVLSLTTRCSVIGEYNMPSYSTVAVITFKDPEDGAGHTECFCPGCEEMPSESPEQIIVVEV